LEALADIAYEVNSTTQNIGARRLHTILERVVEDVSFDGPDRADKKVRIDRPYVQQRLKDILQKEDLTRFIL
ncbi:MAG TPA: HslU--HslV peptidase ATPase subunit, partial [Gemmataceae bacterium]